VASLVQLQLTTEKSKGIEPGTTDLRRQLIHPKPRFQALGEITTSTSLLQPTR